MTFLRLSKTSRPFSIATGIEAKSGLRQSVSSLSQSDTGLAIVEKDHGSSILSDVTSGTHRDTDVRSLQSRRIIDSVA